MKTTFNKESRLRLPDMGALAFTLIAFCLTVISAYNGFKFYNTLFGLFMAVMISATFEVSRFACLFRYRNSQKRISKMTYKKLAQKTQCLWLSPKQVAKPIQCSIEHVCHLVKTGPICYIRGGKNIMFKPEDYNDYETNSYPMGSGSRRDRMDPKSI